MRGPYLSRGDKGYRTAENCSNPSKIRSLTLYWNLNFFYSHLSVIDLIFLASAEFFSVTITLFTMTETNLQLF